MIQQVIRNNRKETDPYWDAFERLEMKQPSWLFPIRKAGISRFAELGFPTVRDEDWRFTNVSPIAKLPFQPAPERVRGELDSAAVQKYCFTNLKASQLVFLDGHFAPALSTILPQADGIKIGSLASALEKDPAVVEKHLGRYSQVEDNAFASLNTAFFRDGAFIHVPAGQSVESPVHMLFISDRKSTRL